MPNNDLEKKELRVERHIPTPENVTERVFERPERQGSQKTITYTNKTFVTKKVFSYTALGLSLVALASVAIAAGVLIYFLTAVV